MIGEGDRAEVGIENCRRNIGADAQTGEVVRVRYTRTATNLRRSELTETIYYLYMVGLYVCTC